MNKEYEIELLRFGIYIGRVKEILDSIEEDLENIQEFDLPKELAITIKKAKKDLERSIELLDIA